MRFSRFELERWATWLDLETSYSVAKFPTPEQLRYFEMGVDRGEFSWASSSAGYLHRAGLLTGLDDAGAILRFVQNVGKSAHNHMACAAVARVYFGSDTSLLSAYFNVQDEWRNMLGGVEPLEVTAGSGKEQGKKFAVLQGIQDAKDYEGFQKYLRRIALPVHAGFISLCSQFDWPQPGVSSTEDVRVWSSYGDTEVERIISTLDT